jgi:hypothetical protein
MVWYILSFAITPAIVFASVVTQGRILPSLSSASTWTIEYVPMILTSLTGVFFSFKGRKATNARNIFYITFFLNILLAGAFVYTVIHLWGDKI